MLKAIIIDDEKDGRENLEELIRKYCPSINLVATADSARTGLQKIQAHQPDLIFLDVEMPNGNGFDLLEKTGNINFEIIFTTAYDQYALRAIKFAALDYLLKPIGINELVATIEKVKQKKELLSSRQNYEVLVKNLQQADKSSKQIALPTSEGFAFVKLNDIIYCEADSNYTYIHLAGKEKVFVSRTLKEYEEMLEENDFMRVHKSYLINLHHVKQYLKGKGGVAVMSNGQVIEISHRKKDEFLQRLV